MAEYCSAVYSPIKFCVPITYPPMRSWFLYPMAIMDWHTRKVLAWRISNTLESDFYVEALNEAIQKFGLTEIMKPAPTSRSRK